jgi:DNA invertase Pin-like site-specific DNA recombinase
MAEVKKRRAVGIVRVSRVGDRGGESFISPDDQRARIREACQRNGWHLLDIFPELDVSGGAPLERRPGLRRAVELVEAARADVIVVAYFDRLVRNLRVQLDVVERVERADGEILTLDHGSLTNGNAVQRLSSTMLGAVTEYLRMATAERTAGAKVAAVARGVPPFPNLPFYLRRGGNGDGPIEHVPEKLAVARKAVRMRADGATIKKVREYLHENGVALSFHGVQTFLASRMLLGELRYGESVNPSAFPPIVDAETWKRTQAQKLPRGRRPTNQRLLARLGVLRCGTCGARMVIGTTSAHGGRRYWNYRCPPPSDCPRRATIAAGIVEEVVEEEVRRLLAGIKGRASAVSGVEAAARELERRQAELDSATRIALGAGISDEASALERLSELREARDEAAGRLEELSAATDASALVIDAERDWSLLTLEERRALIRAVVAQAVVSPGRGPNRVTVEPRQALRE